MTDRFGYLVSIEGIDCTGKTVLVQRLARLLRRRGLSCEIKPEFPTSKFIQQELDAALSRSIFFSHGFGGGPIPALFFMLYAEAQNLCLSRSSAQILLADRHLDSLAIYQGYFALPTHRFNPLLAVESLERLYSLVDLPLAKRTFLLHAPLTVLSTRFHERHGRRFTSEEASVLNDLQSAYEGLARHYSRFYSLDANRPLQEVSEEALQVILGDLEGRKS